MKASEKCDVYSFRVVTLEVIMGKHPGDLFSSFLSTSFASSSYDVLLEDVLDQRLALPTRQVAKKVVVVAKIALACLHQSTFSSDHATSLSEAINLEIPVHKAFGHDHIKRTCWSRKSDLSFTSVLHILKYAILFVYIRSSCIVLNTYKAKTKYFFFKKKKPQFA